MLDKLFGFIATLSPTEANQGDGYSPDDSRVAAAALMYHVIQADGVLREVEKDRFTDLVKDQNDLAGKELAQLLAAAKKADAEAVDLYRFTSVLIRQLEEDQRIHFIELLWELVYADGVRHELEDNVVWRISELMGVSARDRVEMRMRVEARMNSSDT